jgi:hypothetical protein
VPTVICGRLFVMFAPMIFRLSNSYFGGITGFSENVYLWNWLLVRAILFGASGVLFLLRLGRARRRVGRGRRLLRMPDSPRRWLPRRAFHTMCERE